MWFHPYWFSVSLHAEVPSSESYRAPTEPQIFGLSANGQWRVPSLGPALQKARTSRGSYLEARKTPRYVMFSHIWAWGPWSLNGYVPEVVHWLHMLSV